MTPNLQRPEAIFLDWDGTLVDSFEFLLKAHNHVRSIFEIPPFTAEVFNDYFGQPRELLYKNLYGVHAQDAKAHFEKFVTANHLNHLSPLPGADELIRTIKNMKIKCGIVSNKKGNFVRAEIAHFGWLPLMDSIVGAGEAARDKPAPDPLLLAMKQAEVTQNLSSIWYVGDSETDAQCARDAGCPLILIEHGNALNTWVQPYAPALVVKNCPELTAFLLQWH